MKSETFFVNSFFPVVFFLLKERNTDLLLGVDMLNSDLSSIKCDDYAKEDGFPDVLDLSRLAFFQRPKKTTCNPQ